MRGEDAVATSTRVLPVIRREAPAVVLVLDVRRGAVVHATTGALDLGGDVTGLPVPVADWTQAAQLARPGGVPFAPGTDPVARVVAGEAVPGEPVCVPGALGYRPMWATGFPLPPRGDEEHALLVLVETEDGDGVSDAAVRDRAVIAAGLSFTISDPRLPDNALVFVNPAFERTTGWSWEEVRGRNCRFLQGPETDPADVQRVREAIEREEHAVITLLNVRKDGSPFWNELSISPVYDGSGALTHFVGIQADVTARVRGERQRADHLLSEQQARADAELAQSRLALLAEATSMLAGTLDVDEALRLLAGLVVPRLADWCMVEMVDGDDSRTVTRHVDPGKHALLDRVVDLQPLQRTDASPVSQVLASGRPFLVPEVTPELLAQLSRGDELARLYAELGGRSGLVVPLRARRQVLGVLSLVSSESGRTYDDADLSMVSDLARRAALAVDNARLYQREHAVAEQLQRSLLPQLPDVPGLDVAAVYLPGSTAAQVGGDWYDLFALPDGVLGVAIGDVMGHDLQAAASMGQLRSVLRSYAWQGSSPAVVLDHLDQLVQGLHMAALATAVYARLTLPEGDRPGRLHFANAGHLPPVLRRPDGTTVLLDGAPGLLVGAALGIDREEREVEVPPGTVLVLCTDGLVERRGLDPDEGLERLRATVEAAVGTTARELADALLAELAAGELDDDVALLVVRVL
ncbi:MAG: putative sensor protein [Frankiales bacterium]|nr:putative sensor protein [Frankiales bacterium]